MIIHVDPAGTIRLDDPDTFSAFHVSAPGQDLTAVLATLGEDACSLDGEHIWISVDRLHALGAAHGGAEWRAGCEGMLAFAAGKGWVDDARGAVRAHLES